MKFLYGLIVYIFLTVTQSIILVRWATSQGISIPALNEFIREHRGAFMVLEITRIFLAIYWAIIL